MTVIVFPPKTEGGANGWTVEERNQLEALYAARTNCGEVSECAFETTEIGEPQFFLLGPAPRCDCVLSISRVSGRYVVEDGSGGFICDAAGLEEVMQTASALQLRRPATGLVPRIALGWYAFREFVEGRTEPLVGEITEVAEVLTHVVPQVAALA
jgi:hypothetical protein